MATDLGVLAASRPAGAERDGRRAARVVRAVAGVLAAIAVAVGLALRIWALGRAPMNSDEAVVGLMAHEILNGHFFAFYWGQSYGGVEPYLTAVLFGLLGQSSITLSLTAMLLDAVAALLVWRIGRRLFSPAVGVGAGVLFFVFPEVYVWQSTIEYGFRWAALVLGLAMLVTALRLCEDPPSPPGRLAMLRDWVLLGACLGLGWWATPEIAYYALPSAALLAWSVLRRGLRPHPLDLVAGVAVAVVSDLPWLWDNVGHGFPSLRHSPQGPGTGGFVNHLRILASKVLPMLLGLRLRASGSWLFYAPLAKGLYVLAVIAGVVFLVACVLRRRAVVLVVFAVLGPLIYAYSPFTWYWQDGRYALFLAPPVALIAVAAAVEGGRLLRLQRAAVALRLELRQVVGPVLAVLVGLGFTLGALGRLDPYRPAPVTGRTSWTSWQPDPSSYLQPTVTALEQAGVTDAYAGYWVAYDLAFQSGGKLVVTDITSFARYRPYLEQAIASPSTAWLFPSAAGLPALTAETGTPLLDPGCIGGTPCPSGITAADLEAYLRSRHDPYRRMVAGDFLAVLPERAVSPFAVAAAAGIKV